MALSNNLTKTAGELCFIWNFSNCEAPNLKIYRPICVPSYFIMFRVSMESSNDEVEEIDKADITLHSFRNLSEP